MPDEAETKSGAHGADDPHVAGLKTQSGVTPPHREPKKSLRHELRTPLNQIIGYAEMLQEDAGEMGRDDFVADLRRIEQAGRTLLEMVNRLTEEKAPATDRAGEGAPTTERDSSPPRRSRGPSSLSARPGRSVGGRILVVDDDELNRDMLARRLEQRGYTVQAAEGGRAAMQAVKESEYDVVLLDVIMPEISGLEVLRTLRESADMAELPIIMATARDASEDVVEALALGANDYVTKPLDFAVVLARVETQLALKHARDEVRDLNLRLDVAQHRIGELVDASVGALDDVAKWAASVAKEVADAIGAKAVSFWLREHDGTSDVTRDDSLAPSEAELRQLMVSGRTVGRGDDTLVPVLGHSGELFGVVIVTTRGEPLPEPAERLVSNFTRHLGGALELGRARRELAAANQRHRVSRQELLDKGVELLAVCPKCRRCFDHRTPACTHDGTELASRQLTPYRISGRYRLDRVVGEGGMGTVYRAYDDRLERDVAIKLIRSEHFHNDNVRMRFENEARAVAKIDHPGVIAVYDSGELDDQSLFIVMEWLEGADLGDVLKAFGPGRPSEVAEMLRQASSALDAAHAAQLVHRDIKPENIFTCRQGGGLRYRLLDFGVAKELTRNARLTETGSLIGTPLYMSPEQLMGRPIDARSDLYSLAAVAYEALTGQRAVRAQEFGQVLLEVVSSPAPTLGSVLQAVPHEVEAAFARAFEKEPRNRPGSVTEWVESFASALSAMPSRAVGWTDGESPRSIQVNPTPELPRPDVQAPTLGAVLHKTRAEES